MWLLPPLRRPWPWASGWCALITPPTASSHASPTAWCIGEGAGGGEWGARGWDGEDRGKWVVCAEHPSNSCTCFSAPHVLHPTPPSSNHTDHRDSNQFSHCVAAALATGHQRLSTPQLHCFPTASLLTPSPPASCLYQQCPQAQ